ncbi:lysoplasmalogenase [Agromyces aurantiacus]|uniref:Lysoplasmalogenase n=1 Tax=Agromyces aurantiacus TaxID=165814 RepID=A0ABV9R7S7_9MICO|nr:lysoplasmalogenase [Agromyces aurantiacus]MBM7504409.1 putative membrane protein YhhN [Agromyces aurantiacus]
MGAPALAFAPYAALSLVHLVVLQAMPDPTAVTATKLLLMPALAAGVLLARPPRTRSTLLLLAAIALSWAGDAALTGAGAGWFVAGLLAFLAAHVAYVVLFAGSGRGRRMPAWTAVYAVWYAGFLALLAPHLGALLAPVAVYGLVLGAMAALAGRLGGIIALGGALFVVSDSVLALGRFLPGYGFALHDLAVMTTYLAAQGLIALGILRLAGTPAVSRAGRVAAAPTAATPAAPTPSTTDPA